MTSDTTPAAQTPPQKGTSDARITSAAAPRSAVPDNDAPETPAERRMINMLIVGIMVVIFGAAFWLGDALLDARRADECMASGRRNCGPITVPSPLPR